MIRLLITGAGHPVAEGTLTNLRAAGKTRFLIVGVDVPERGRGFEWVDRHYAVPHAESPDFIPAVLDICRRESIQLAIPWSDDEAEAMARDRALFEDLGTALLCGSHRSILRSVDKGTLLSELHESGLPAPEFRLACSPAGLQDAALDLGYPDRKIVIKPRRGSCSHGLWVLDSSVDLLNAYTGPGAQTTLNSFLALMRDVREAGRALPEYVVMEYLPGQDFSVDVLADSGQALLAIPRRRVQAVEGISQAGEFTADSKVRSMVARVVEEFGLHLNVNVQLRYAQRDGGEPLVYEINPRISGSIAANDLAGVSLLYLGIQLALGNAPPPAGELRIRGGNMSRSWICRFSPADRWFAP